MKFLSTLLLSGVGTLCLAQSGVNWATRFASDIDTADLKKHLTVLASDEYEGRETGKNGQKMAAAYIENRFKELGCAMAPGMTSYQQYFDVIETTPGGSLAFGKAKLNFRTDFIYMSAKSNVNFADVKMYTEENLVFKKDIGAYAIVHKLEGLGVREEVKKLKEGVPAGLRAIVLLVEDYETIYEYLEHYTTNKTMRLAEQKMQEEIPVIIVRSAAVSGQVPKTFSGLISVKKDKKLRKLTPVGYLGADLNINEQKLTSSNVLAYIEGSDPALKNEVLVITAHYDHIGIDNGVVFNGADDDGTGTVALLELAEAYMDAKNSGHGPKRSVLIMTVSGEEKGLLGSSYYVSHPVIPLANTIADLNIDMIGRYDIAHEPDLPKREKVNITGGGNEHRELKPIEFHDYIYVIGSNMLSDDLHNANELANSKYTHLNLDYKFNSLTDPNQFYFRSDHYNFAKNNIPSIFYFSGVHEDYHQPTDDVEKINFQKTETVARLVFYTGWELLNAAKRPAVNH
jgi:hypothetical protein